MPVSEETRTKARDAVHRLSRKRDILRGRISHIETLKRDEDSNFQMRWNSQSEDWKRSLEGIQYKAAAEDDSRRYTFDLEILQGQIDDTSTELRLMELIASG